MSSSEEPKKKRKTKKDAPSVEELRERLAQLVEPPIEEVKERKQILGTNVTPSEVE